MFEYVITPYQTLQTWIDRNATRYHKFNALPHGYHVPYHTFSLSLTWKGHNATCFHNFSVLSHTLPYIFCQCNMIWGCLQRVTVKFIIYTCILIFFLKKMMVTKTSQNQANLKENIR